MSSSPERKRVVTSEEIQSTLDELADFMVDQADEANKRTRKSGRVATRFTERPDLRRRYLDEVRAGLEDEVVIAKPAGGDEDISLSEREMEIAKRALLHLRLDQLKMIADTEGLDRRGTAEELADRIARAYRADEEDIAKLILENEEPRPERGFADRLYAVDTSKTTPETVIANLESLTGRYVRVGVAQWLIFRSVRVRDDEIVVEALYKSYRATADEEQGQFFIAATPLTADVRLRWEPSIDFVRVRSRGATEGAAAVRGFIRATLLDRRDSFPFDVTVGEGQLYRWDRRSVLMLDLLSRRLVDDISILNLSTAKFESPNPRGGRELRPDVRTVRFEGQHLLSSRPACQLLVDGRALVDVTMFVRYAPTRDQSYVLPVRIALQKEHVTVLTGFGTEHPRIAAEVQELLVSQVSGALIGGVTTDNELETLAGQIRERAAGEQPIGKADILAAPEEWSDVLEDE